MRARAVAVRPRGAAAVLALSIALDLGCAWRRGGDRPLEFWALGREAEAVTRMMAGFERRYPGVAVHVQQIPWSAAHEKLLTAYVGEAMPDVFQSGNTWIPELAALNALLPLDERLRGSPAVSPSDYFPGVLEANVVEGRTYGVSWYVDTRLLFYRADLLERAGLSSPPRTWSAWRDGMTRVKERAAAGEFAILLPVNEWQPLVILALQRGAGLLRDHDTRGDFESPAFREAFVFYLDLFRRGLAPLATASAVANVVQDFGRGTFAFYVTGPWNLGEFRARLPPSVRWATATMPAPDDGGPGASLAGGASLAIFRRSPRAEAAWRLVEYLSEAAQQAELYRLTGDLPARKSAWSAAAGPGAEPAAAAFREQLEHVRPTPRIPEWERIAALVARYAEEAARGRLDAAAALAALDRDVDDLLEKRRWMLRRGGS